MKLDSLVRRRRYCRLKSCGPHENGVSKRTPYRLRLRVDAMAHGSALHEYNRMMPILPRDRCRQSRDESRLRATDDLFEAVGGQMVALVYDQVAIFTDAIFDDAFARETLYESDVECTARFAASATDSSDVTAVDV